jgi:hypothetical protein
VARRAEKRHKTREQAKGRIIAGYVVEVEWGMGGSWYRQVVVLVSSCEEESRMKKRRGWSCRRCRVGLEPRRLAGEQRTTVATRTARARLDRITIVY